MAQKNEVNQKGYNVGALDYPEGVGSKPDLLHYVEFFINVREGSQFRNKINEDVIPNNGRYDSTAYYNGGALTKAAALAVGASVLTGVGNAALNAKPSTDGKTSAGTNAARGFLRGALKVGMATGGAIALAETAIGVSDNLDPRKKLRLADVICLATQERPSVSYGVNYQDKDMGILGGFLTDQSAAGLNTFDDASQSALLQATKIPSLLPGFGGASAADIIQLGAKAKTNPFREVFFEGIDYRKFNFRYKFMPRTRKESEAVLKIITTFKQHMHPEVASNGYFYVYPSEFEISYCYGRNQYNKYFNKIGQCALTDMSVEYGGEQFSTFNNGSPTEINLTLSFRELELVTKNSILEQGY
jgi:hypothetical protein